MNFVSYLLPLMAMSTSLLLSSLSIHHSPVPSQNPILPVRPNFILSRRNFIFATTSLSSILPFDLQWQQHIAISSVAETDSPPSPPPPPSTSILSGIVNTKSWFQFYGDGFAIRVPPQFEDIMEPEDYNAGLSLYGDKAKPKTFAARFASSDGSEVLSVVTRPSNQLKITFLEAKDITDFGPLKDAAKIFVPVGKRLILVVVVLQPNEVGNILAGATLYSARTIKVKEDEGFRTYYFYEFGRDEQHVALVAAVNSGKAIIAGATAPQSKWDDDGMKLRSAAISLTVL